MACFKQVRLASCIPCLIDVDMVIVSISKMKNGKAAGPSGVVSEMVTVVGGAGADMITDLVWELSTSVNCHRGKYVL